MKVTKEDFDKVVKVLSKSKYPMTIMLVPKWDEIDIVIGQDAPDQIVDDIGQRLDSIGLNWGGSSGISISGASSNYDRREYSDIFRVKGGHKDYYYESTNKKDLQLIQEFFSKPIHENEMDALGDELADAIEDKLEDKKDELNEIVDPISVLSTVLAGTTLTNILAKYAGKLFKKYNFGKGEEAAKKIYDFTHKLEGDFKKPIERVIGLFTKDAKTKKIVTDSLYALLILALGVKAGGGALQSLSKGNVSAGTVSGLKAALKGKDLSTLIKDIAGTVA